MLAYSSLHKTHAPHTTTLSEHGTLLYLEHHFYTTTIANVDWLRNTWLKNALLLVIITATSLAAIGFACGYIRLAGCDVTQYHGLQK